MSKLSRPPAEIAYWKRRIAELEGIVNDQLARWFEAVIQGRYLPEPGSAFAPDVTLGEMAQLERDIEAYKALVQVEEEAPPTIFHAPSTAEVRSRIPDEGDLTIAVVSYHTNPLCAIRERVWQEEGIEIDLYDQGGQGTYQERLAYNLAERFGVNVLSFTLARSYLTKERYLNIHPKAPVIPIPNSSGRFVEDETGLVKKENLYFIIDELVDATLDYLLENDIEVDVFSGHYPTGVAACRRLRRRYRELGRGNALFSATTHSLGWNKFVNIAHRCSLEELEELNLDRRLKEERRGFQEADLVITVSPTGTETVTHPSLYGVSSEKVVSIPGGVDATLFRPYDPRRDGERVEALRHEYGIAEDERVILMVGRLWDYKRKGVDTGIEVCARLQREANDRLKFVFVGLSPKDHSNRREIEALVRKGGIWGNSVLMELVPHEQIPTWLQLAARSKGIVLALPRTEPWGLANLEAMAVGNVVVTINKEGPPHYIVDGENGILVDRRNIPQVKDRILEILRNETLAQRIRKNAHLTAQREYSWKGVARRFLWAHLRLMEGRA